jgi:hypothetical protein
MKTLRLTLALVAFSTLTAAVANAQATRTWVSGVGDDANPCSRTAPCKTFAGAISKTAAHGEINVLDPGGFGGVTITKSISIEAEGVIAGVLVSGTNGIVINAGPNDSVVLRGLTIEGVGAGLNGIRWLAGANLVIEKCTIRGFTQKGVDAEPNSATPGAVSNLFISDTQFRDNAGGGVLAKPLGTNALKGTLSRVQFNNNFYGVRAEDNAYLNVKDSAVSQNSTDAFLALGTYNNAVIYVENSTANNSGIGVHAVGPAIVFISNTLVTANHTGLMSETGGSIYSWGNNRVGGNFVVNGTPSFTIGQE